MIDPIDRQAALDAVSRGCKEFRGIFAECEKNLNELPSTQPEIVRCRECKHYYFADNRIPQEHRYTCELDGDRWEPDDYCSFAERRTDTDMRGEQYENR